MPCARARGGPASVVLPLVALAVLAGPLSACGAAGGSSASARRGEASSGPAPSQETVACRARWKDLAQDAAVHEETNPSALPQRWVSVAATIDYYATSGTAKDCEETLSGQQKAMSALSAFGKRLEPYDLPLQYAEVRNAAESYASGPRPAPTRTKAAKGRKAQVVKAPEPAAVGRALRTLEQQSALATRQQGPAWQQAEVVELGDDAAVAKALKDLRFLSSQSSGYRAGTAALGQVRAAVALKR